MKQKKTDRSLNMKEFRGRDVVVVQQMMHQIHLTSVGFVFKIWKEANLKIMTGLHDSAWVVLYEYLAEMDGLGIGIFNNKKLKVSIKLIPKLKFVKNKHIIDTNCKHIKPRKFQKMWKLKCKTNLKTALGMVVNENFDKESIIN